MFISLHVYATGVYLGHSKNDELIIVNKYSTILHKSTMSRHNYKFQNLDKSKNPKRQTLISL